MQFCLWSGRPATINPVPLSRSLFSLSFFHRRTNSVWRSILKRNLSAVRRDMRIAPWTAKKKLAGYEDWNIVSADVCVSLPSLFVSSFFFDYAHPASITPLSYACLFSPTLFILFPALSSFALSQPTCSTCFFLVFYLSSDWSISCHC